MKKLEAPAYAATDLYDKSVAGLSDAALRTKFVENRPQVVEAFDAFNSASLTRTWCNLPRAAHGQSNAIIVGNLSKAELVGLYDDGVVRSKGEPRKIYDQIKLSAYGECPYCGIGELGEVGIVDHFLPKALFPSYSVLPLNLVPACQVCNKCMGSSFPTEPNRQPLHPYLDEDHFFYQKWTTGTLREDGPPWVMDFDVDPPPDWPAIDRERVMQHFKVCKLKERYRSHVQGELTLLGDQRNTTLRAFSADDFRDFLLVNANQPSLPINGWKRTLYSVLVGSAWFCEREFN